MAAPGPAQSRTCVACGRNIPWDVNVCPYCGHDYRPQMAGVQAAPAAETVSGGMKILLYILSFLIPIVGFIIGAIYYTKPEREYKEVGKMCIILGILSIVLSVVCYFVVLAAIFASPWYYYY